ncbi:MAG TPA: hypothetical protein VNQ90_18600 [Chthoniobacteraceae bacterium]|nr:hypothetical protein [Chthoniobacteraceae bacterium]
MHLIRAALCPSILAVAAVLLPLKATGEETQPPRLKLPSIDAPCQLDGKLDEAFWETLPVHDGFHAIKGKLKEGDDATRFRAAVSGETLLIGVTCRQPENEIIANITQRGLTAVCSDDSVEIFLSPDESGSYQLAVNAMGTLYDQWHPRQQSHTPSFWNGAWEAAVHREPHQWSAEFAIPLAALNRTSSDTSMPWRLNVARTIKEESVYLSWAPVKRGFMDWERHGVATFAVPSPYRHPFDLSATMFPPLLVGRNSLDLVLKAPAAGGPYTVKTSLRTWEPGPLPERRTAREHLPIRQGELYIPLEVPIDEAGQLHELIVELIDEQKQATVSLLAHTFRPPNPLEVEMDELIYFKSDQCIGMNVTLNTPQNSGGKFRLQIRDPAGNIVFEQETPVPSESRFRLEAPTAKIPHGFYQIEVSSRSAPESMNWRGTFQLMKGPF